ncbi:MAG TPA: MT-A70 family methyltransferase [Sphingomicrobium sp.]|nr:MT-A70 family methyltransferase [Sphingomicrobium sp.]
MSNPLAHLPHRHFGCILADPAWSFRGYTQQLSDRDIQRHYATMKLEEIKALPVGDVAAPDSHLFLWATGPHLPAAFDVMAAWGFRYSGMAFTWIKLKRSFDARQLRVLPTLEADLHVGLGFTTRKNAEFCLLGRRGSARRNAKDVREIILSPVREHSRKPEEARDRIERYCDGPYLELFARSARPGWTAWGNEVGKFEAAA